MKLKIMEGALVSCPNRFQLTMMAVARAKEINDGEISYVDVDDEAKPVVLALKEIAEGRVLPSTHDEMNKIREAKRILRERALMEAEEEESAENEDSYASALLSEDPVEN